MKRDGVVVWGLRAVTLMLLGFLLLMLFWAVIDRSPPVKIMSGETVGYQRQADGSWIIIVRWHGERYRVCWGNSKRWITDSEDGSLGLVLPLDDIAYPPDSDIRREGPYEWEVPVHVPAYFETAGHTKGAYRIRILYSCNPLQMHAFPIVVEPPAVQFTLPMDRSVPAQTNG